MYQRVDVVPVVSRSMVGMHLDILQVIHHMAAKIQNKKHSFLSPSGSGGSHLV